jgi:folate-binding protein YgfZ
MALTLEDEYGALHREAVWVDRSTRDARLDVRGPDATEWLQGLLTQDVKSLRPGQGAYATYLTPQGRMVADLRVFHRGETYLIETAAAARTQLLSRLDQFVIMEDVTVADVTEAIGCLTVLGPAAATAVAACVGTTIDDLERLPENGHVALEPSGAVVARSAEFGLPGFDLFAPTQHIGTWRARLAARIPMASERLVEVARIEAGRPRFGVDMHDDTIPLEAGLEARAISFDKGCYVGQEVVIRILHRGQGRVARRLVWVEHVPYPPDEPGWQAGEQAMLGDKAIGQITSVCWSPARGGMLGIAMLHRDATEPGTIVRIGAHDATVQRLP